MDFLILQTISIGLLISLAAAYFEIDVQSFEQLSDSKFADFTNLKIRKDKESKTRKIYGNVSINVDIDNSFKETILLYVKQGGEYRKMPYKAAEKGFCDFLTDDTYFYPDFAENSDFKFPFTCPLPAGVYELRGYLPSLKNFPITIMPTGDYLAETLVTKDGELVYHTKVAASIINI